MGPSYGARKRCVQKKNLSVIWFKGKIYCCCSNMMVAKRRSNGFVSAGPHHPVNLQTYISVNEDYPISKFCRVNKMKTRFEGPWATMSALLCNNNFSSILIRKGFHTCGLPNQTFIRLSLKAFVVNQCKTIVDPTQNVINSARISYVTPSAVIGGGTRSPVMRGSRLKVYPILKGAGISARRLITTGAEEQSLEWLTQELINLRVSSVKNDFERVNFIVNSLLGSPEFWAHCYESIKSNPGTHALGGGDIDNLKPLTLDGIDLDFFTTLAKAIKTGRFRFGSSRLTLIPKPQGGTRPLGIANSRDKIVQKGIAIILEQVAEHRFYEGSFGSRRGKSCHDALKYVRRKVPSGTWAIEGDISKCFDNFEHKRLVSLISKKYISLQIFKDLLYKALKVRIVSLNSTFVNKIGTPQGSVVRPILSNILLHKLDMYVTESFEMSKFRNKKNPAVNHKFTQFIKPTKSELLQADSVRSAKGKLKYWQFLHKLRVSKLKQAEILKIPRLKPNGTNQKIAYVRYVDDFIIFAWGTKDDCIKIKEMVKNFLKSQLALKLSIEKTKITYLKGDKALFLGFEFWQSTGKLISTKKDVNPLGKIDRNKMSARYRGATMQIPRLRITFSMTAVLSKLVDKGLVRHKGGKFFPTSYKPALQYDIPNIINYLKSVFRGLANYYGYAHNWYDAKTLYNYFGRFCVAMTIAHKTKSKVPKVFQKYGPDLTVLNDKNKPITKFALLTNANFKKDISRAESPMAVADVEHLLAKHLKIGKMHMISWPCVICGAPAEMHHIKHVRKVLKTKTPKSFNAYLEAMRIVNRKTLPVCKEHHLQIHKGVYDGTSLKQLFKSFKSAGVGFNKKQAKDLIYKASGIDTPGLPKK